MQSLHPIRLKSSLHETIWGGRRLERDGWKQLPPGNIAIGESWETELTTVAQNEPYMGSTLGSLVEELDSRLLGERVIARFGHRFPLLAKILDANAKLSVQVHPDDTYARLHEQGKLGKTEFWYVLDAAPGASIIHGFKATTSQEEVRQAIQDLTLENLLKKVNVSAGDIIFVPAGTVHAIGKGVLLYELQEYSDLTYRLYDYGRLTSTGIPRELHVERSLDVSHYDCSPHIKMQSLPLQNGDSFKNRCLAACQYFVTCELVLHKNTLMSDYMKNEIHESCIILTSLGAEVVVRYGDNLDYGEKIVKGQTMILPAELGTFCIEGSGALLYSYVPGPEDEIWHAWEVKNGL
ncbi:MAG TPA: type I phosphomannose isomerase catalytic subunit [Ktedonobacteraceae bacterium]